MIMKLDRIFKIWKLYKLFSLFLSIYSALDSFTDYSEFWELDVENIEKGPGSLFYTSGIPPPPPHPKYLGTISKEENSLK